MPESGGVVTWPFSWVDDAALGIKILASRQDAQWLDAKIIIENLLCRDGQNSIAANIDWGGFRIENLGICMNATDAASKEYVDSVTSADLAGPYMGPFQIGSPPQTVRILNADFTPTLQIGMRIKVVHTNGTLTMWGTIINVAFSSPNTDVRIQPDNSGDLLGLSIVSISWSQFLTEPSTLPRMSYTSVMSNNAPFSQTLVSGDGNIMGIDTGLVGYVWADALNEYDRNTGFFQARVAGTYEITGRFSIAPGATVMTKAFEAQLYRNGILMPQSLAGLSFGSTSLSLGRLYTPTTNFTWVTTLSPSIYCHINLGGTFTGAAPTADWLWTIRRVF